MIKSKFSLYISLIFLLASCTKAIVRIPPGDMVGKQEFTFEQIITKKLYNQYHQWEGVPHRYGGLSKKGIDCSGFVYLTYRELFNISLPRTTEEQSSIGKRVTREQLLPGDLLFFKTGWFSQHVGIFIERNTFLHASTSKGVILSSLAEEYWSSNFYIAKRAEIR